VSTIKITLERAIASMTKVNPYQTLATFIFADDHPNGNNVGLPFEKFEKVAATAVGMPVKIRFIDSFIHEDIGEHEGSIPIGVIQGMEIVTISDDHHQLVATAALWNDEFPREIAWLQSKFEAGEAPGVSYEINYEKDAEAGGVKWIDGDMYTGAATFVKTPAYGSRTALLALASQVSNGEELETGILALAQHINDSKGGNRMDEKEIEALKVELTNLKAEASSKQSEIEELSSKLTELETALQTKDEEISGLKNAALLDSRVRKYTEAGFSLDKDEEKANKKRAILASFNDDQFEDYITELSALKPKTETHQSTSPAMQALASLNSGVVVPKMEFPEETNLSTLKQGLRGLARPNSID